MRKWRANVTSAVDGRYFPPRLYRRWTAMQWRCYGTDAKYKPYRDKNITVCPEWEDYAAFRSWAVANGYRKGLSIDRIDNSKGYSPDNCQWISMGENSSKDRMGEDHPMSRVPDQDVALAKFLVTSLGFSQPAVGKLLNTDRRNVGQWINGKVRRGVEFQFPQEQQ